MTEWITDRPPTEADADPDGDVLIRRSSTDFIYLPWRYVAAGAPWRRTGNFLAPAAEPTPLPVPAHIAECRIIPELTREVPADA